MRINFFESRSAWPRQVVTSCCRSSLFQSIFGLRYSNDKNAEVTIFMPTSLDWLTKSNVEVFISHQQPINVLFSHFTTDAHHAQCIVQRLERTRSLFLLHISLQDFKAMIKSLKFEFPHFFFVDSSLAHHLCSIHAFIFCNLLKIWNWINKFYELFPTM